MPNGKTTTELGYEVQDVGWRFVIVSLGILTVLTIISVAGLLWLYQYRDLYTSISDQPVVSTAEERPLPAGPRLQPRPPVELKAYLDSSMAHINSYGWVNEAEGKVHIPIDEAMDLALEQGYAFGPPPPVVVEPEAPAAEEAP